MIIKWNLQINAQMNIHGEQIKNIEVIREWLKELLIQQ